MQSKVKEIQEDLRIYKPFPALLDLANSYNFESMEKIEHGHIPWVIILIRTLEQWKANHGGNQPKTMAEKAEFKDCIKAISFNIFEEVCF